jgi:hypothetical protein
VFVCMCGFRCMSLRVSKLIPATDKLWCNISFIIHSISRLIWHENTTSKFPVSFYRTSGTELCTVTQ